MATIENVITAGEYDIIEVLTDPSISGGTAAPLGSLAIQRDIGGNTAFLWQKTGISDTSWIKVGSSTDSVSPGFSFGRSGDVKTGTFLQNETVPSNVSGRWVFINNAIVHRVFVSNESTTTYKIEVMYHDGNGANLTSLGTVTVTSAKGNSFSVSWPVPINKQLAVRMATDSPNSAKNLVVGLQLLGAL